MAKKKRPFRPGPRHTRRTADRTRLSRLIDLIPEFFVSGPEQLGWALRVLGEQLGDSREVAACLVAAHGPGIRSHGDMPRLRMARTVPEVDALFPKLRSGSPSSRLQEAVTLVHQRKARGAAVELARRYGLTVFDELNTHAAVPEIRELLQRKPRKRPKGSTTRDFEAWVVDQVHAALAEFPSRRGAPRAALLQFVGRNPKSATPTGKDPGERSEKTADAKWFRRRLKRGRELRNGASSPDARIAYLTDYLRDLPAHERLRGLIQFLASARRNN